MKPSPAPWERETVQLREERAAYEVVKDAEGGILFDTLNSNVAVIHDADEGGPHRWDEQGRVNLTLAAAAPEMFAALKHAQEMLLNLMHVLLDKDKKTRDEIIAANPRMQKIAAALAKAGA